MPLLPLMALLPPTMPNASRSGRQRLHCMARRGCLCRASLVALQVLCACTSASALRRALHPTKWPSLAGSLGLRRPHGCPSPLPWTTRMLAVRCASPALSGHQCRVWPDSAARDGLGGTPCLPGSLRTRRRGDCRPPGPPFAKTRGVLVTFLGPFSGEAWETPAAPPKSSTARERSFSLHRERQCTLILMPAGGLQLARQAWTLASTRSVGATSGERPHTHTSALRKCNTERSLLLHAKIRAALASIVATVATKPSSIPSSDLVLAVELFSHREDSGQQGILWHRREQLGLALSVTHREAPQPHDAHRGTSLCPASPNSHLDPTRASCPHFPEGGAGSASSHPSGWGWQPPSRNVR